MRRPPASSPLALAVLALLATGACGKRADPLAPWVKTPQPPTSFEVAQIGNEIELRLTVPRTTTENRPLPVIQLEWLEAAPTGPIEKSLKVIAKEEVAPGELRVKRMPLTVAPARFTARARSGRAISASAAAVVYAPKPIPLPPTDLQLTAQPDGVLLRWTNPVGAEPWPTPSPTPTPSPSPGTSPASAQSPPPAASPEASSDAKPATAPQPEPRPEAQVQPEQAPPAGPPPAGGPPGPRPDAPGGKPGAPPTAAARPSPRPTAPPLPPTGIRIFRTDGAVRAAREPLQANTWLDTSVKTGDKPCYALSYATSFKPLVVSVQTEPVCVELKDTTPPVPPLRLTADLAPTFVELSWLPSESPDVAFYRLYRTLGAGVREVVLQTDGLVLRVQDPTLTPGPRTYEVAAVDKAGNESAPTQPTRIVVP